MRDYIDYSGNEEEDAIDVQVFLGDMWRGFVKFWWVPLLCVLLVGGYRFYDSFICYKPMYSCQATYTIHTEDTSYVGDTGLVSYTFSYNSKLSDQLTVVFSYAVNSPLLRSRIASELGVGSLNAHITAACVADSNLLTLTVRAPDPDTAYNTLDAVVRNYASVTDYIIGRTRLITISEPVYPTSPSNSRDWILSVGIGILVGLGIGFVWIVFYAFIRSTVRTKDDIRHKLNTPCLGALPQVTFKKYRTEINTDILLTNPRIGSDFHESLRLLRSSVRSALSEDRGVIMITSTAPGEGKSVVTLNLGGILAKHGARVLVIDCDMRNSGIEPLTGDRVPLTDREDSRYQLYRSPSLGLDLLHFDDRQIRPRHILREPFLRGVLDGLRPSYDYILIDTPPCGVISDAVSVARVVDGVIYVVRQDVIMLDSIRAGLMSIRQTEVPILGCILNGATGGYGGYGSYYSYRGYYRYYRYGYSDSYGRERTGFWRRKEKK